MAVEVDERLIEADNHLQGRNVAGGKGLLLREAEGDAVGFGDAVDFGAGFGDGLADGDGLAAGLLLGAVLDLRDSCCCGATGISWTRRHAPVEIARVVRRLG